MGVVGRCVGCCSLKGDDDWVDGNVEGWRGGVV